ncbi:MAG: tRNA (adenosine(37)-N6)-threonylcarbamoyltransferase complex transferase subunit TsaD [bacterium]|nr:tRNA (adenosine(37)-N6)-threonylcarbamoyltransferase complex transferase subunit TsaD [bacterium]
MKILGIESSCDETAAALLEVKRGVFTLKKNIVASQIAIHARNGGVIPEVAARSHILNVIPVIQKTLGTGRPDVIAVTAGPGLITSLLVGIETAKTLSYLWRKPLVAVNHIEGHVYANFLSDPSISFPALVLIVSGGHTELVLMSGHGTYSIIGMTRDDAAGEAFDKVAKMLGLEYPGGPAISRVAVQGNPLLFELPRPMIDSSDFDFSFSGLKTAVLYLVMDLVKKKKLNEQTKMDLCASFQQAVVDVLVSKTLRAALKYKVRTVLFGGGVIANLALRTQMSHIFTAHAPQITVRFPSLAYCTDNAAMIAVAGYFHALKKDFIDPKKLDARSNWEIGR